MSAATTVFFDIDGVLLDSLPPHLEICRDKAKSFGLEITIPSEESFRKKLIQGERISPMFYFFKSVGFPDAAAKEAVKDYENEFMEKYQPQPFAHCEEVIDTLKSCGLHLGLVTSNVLYNVFPALKVSIDKFESDCIFTHDTAPGKTKAWCLAEGARRLSQEPNSCYYVGDLPADAEAAAEAGFKFIGATYGWGLSKTPHPFETADSLIDIPHKIGCLI